MSLNLDRCLNLPDDFTGYDKRLFCVPKYYENVIDKVLIPHGLIQERVSKLATDIVSDAIKSDRRTLKVVCVLKGGFKFFGDITTKISELSSTCDSLDHVRVSVDFIRVKSYVDTKSSGTVTVMGLEHMTTLESENLLIVEDIVDTGKTIEQLLPKIKELKPKSVSVACLVRKRTPQSSGFIPDYVGFEIPDHFVVGYAFDYNDHFRDILHICTVNQNELNGFK